MVVEYQANWLNDQYNEVIGLTYSTDQGVMKDTSVIRTLNLIADGRPHTIIVKGFISGTLQKMSVGMNTRSSKASLLIKSIDFVKSENEFTGCIDFSKPGGSENPSLQSLDISNRFNANFADVQKGNV